MIYSVMTRKEFISILDERGYTYEIVGGKIIITHKGVVSLSSLTSLPPGVEFRNGRDFRNRGDVYLGFLIGGWFSAWKGNIEGIDSKRLLNFMISKGVFER